MYENTDSATFTFNVVGTIDGKVVYSNVAALSVSSAGSVCEKLTFVPVGATITVTEINSGAHYTAVAQGTGTTVIKAHVTVEPTGQDNVVVIGNTYIPEITNGHGIENKFKPGTDGGWECEPVRQSDRPSVQPVA